MTNLIDDVFCYGTAAAAAQAAAALLPGNEPATKVHCGYPRKR